MAQLRCLVDTNILLRIMNSALAQHLLCVAAVEELQIRGYSLFFTVQNATEFWNVSTRPLERNGHNLSPTTVASSLELIEERMTLLPDDESVYAEWKRLVALHSIRGIQVHDARLAASMIAHRVSSILTLNTQDFTRYAAIDPIHPASLVS